MDNLINKTFYIEYDDYISSKYYENTFFYKMNNTYSFYNNILFYFIITLDIMYLPFIFYCRSRCNTIDPYIWS